MEPKGENMKNVLETLFHAIIINGDWLWKNILQNISIFVTKKKIIWVWNDMTEYSFLGVIIPPKSNYLKVIIFAEIWRAELTHLHLLVSIFGGVLAALTLPAKFLQFSLALLQTLSFTFVFHLIFLQSCLPDEITQLSSQSAAKNIQMDKTRKLMVVFQISISSIHSRKTSSGWMPTRMEWDGALS